MITRLLIALCIMGVIFSCANQTSPTGGPKDEAPPVLEGSVPLNQSTNFRGDQVTLTFDEHIKVDNPTQKIIITPRLDQEVSYSVKRNKLVIGFSEPLAENTTYSINFRDAIKDITEGNIAQLNYAFSTGTHLDSLKISGNVSNILKDIPLNGATVGLQLPTDTAAFYKYPPFYFTTTNKEGDFTINNLKNAEYKVYAFNDRNKDLIVQPSLEAHGFLENVLTLTHDTAGISIPTVSVNLDTLKIISARQAGKYFNVNFNKHVIDYSVTPLSTSLPYLLADDFKTLIFFNINQLTNKIGFTISAEDSVHYNVNEQVIIEYTETQRKPIDFTISPKEFSLVKSNPVINTSLSFNKPIASVNYDSVFYFHDSTSVFNIQEEHLTWDSSRSLLSINYNFPKKIFSTDQADQQAVKEGPKKAMAPKKLYFGKNSFISVEQDSSKQLEVKPKIYEDDQLGTILVKATSDYPNFIVELLDKNYKVVERRYNETNIRFNKLIPQDYFIRIIGDINNNKFWDAGNIHLNLTPEPIEYYININGKKNIPLRANFEIGPHEIQLFSVDNQVD